MTVRACYVVPCHNEAARLDETGFVSVVDDDERIDLLFVNDGSTDDTPRVLEAMAQKRARRVRVMSLAKNSGKAEAVRLGLLEALRTDCAIVGYFDADLATPPKEMRRLLSVMLDSRADVLLGSRVAMLGRHIHRSMVRHYLGRIFATAASIILDLRVYDTQCGAKLLRRSPRLQEALDEPFTSRWVFDVDLIGRLLATQKRLGPLVIMEEPLLEWQDVPGSKVRPAHFFIAASDLARVGWSLRERRRQP